MYIISAISWKLFTFKLRIELPYPYHHYAIYYAIVSSLYEQNIVIHIMYIYRTFLMESSASVNPHRNDNIAKKKLINRYLSIFIIYKVN